MVSTATLDQLEAARQRGCRMVDQRPAGVAATLTAAAGGAALCRISSNPSSAAPTRRMEVTP